MKDVLSQLNTSVAINTEATKGLKEVVEKEFNRHSEDRRGLEVRVIAAEADIDKIKIKMAEDLRAGDRLTSCEKTLAAVEENLKALTKLIDTATGAAAASKWFIGGISSLGTAVLVVIIEKLWH